MKRPLFNQHFKQTMLAVPAAALMLGAAQAGTTVGLNFQAWYYDSGTTPQTVGYGAGYQTTGFPVTAKAFGVAAANWSNTDPLDCQSAISTSVTFGGTLTAQLTAPNAWQSGIGEQVAGWNPETVAPGNDEVTWGYLDDGNATGNSPSVSVSGLATQFPNGYVIQTIAANSGVKTYDGVDITDGVTTNSVAYSTYYIANPINDGYSLGGTVGLSGPSGAFTSDTININCHPKTAPNRSTLAGIIITDQPVVSQDPVNTTVNQGAALTLSAMTIGLTNALFYQWRLNGTPIPGANNVTYTKAGVTTADDAGSYDLVVTNLYGSTVSGVAVVTVNNIAAIATDLAGVISTVYAGANFSGWSVVGSGALPLSYQWFMDGDPVAGATNATLTLTSVTTSDAGNYSVTVTNVYGSAKSSTNQLIVLSSPNLYTTDVVQDSPGAYWPLNDATGSALAEDYSGNGNNGTNNGGLTLGVDGPRPPAYKGFDAGKLAYEFDGASAYIDCGTGPSVSGTSDFAVEAWINTTATVQGVIIQQRSATGYNGEYQFSVQAGGNLSFYVFGGGGYQFSFSTTRTVNDGQWHYVAAERSGANGFIYIDGTLAASASGTVAPLDPTIATYIGDDQRGASTYFNGMISDVAIYPYALSTHSITLHAYNGQSGNAPFSISFSPGGYVIDSKPVGTLHPGINYNATWTNSFTDAVPVTRNGVEVFSGDSQIVIPASPDLNSTNGTIMFWMQVNGNVPISGPGNEGAILFDCRTTNGAVIVLHDDGSIFWQGQGGSQNSFEAGNVYDGNWHHVAVTYGQTTNDTISVYIDGQLSAFVAVTNGWSWPAGQEIEIGKSHDSYWQIFTGLMDDFRIYRRVLNATEIASVQSSDALVDTSALLVRYNFDTAGAGLSLNWTVGSLLSSPTLGAGAVWTAVPNATPPYPVLPPDAAPADTMLFYRAGF